MPRQLLRWLIFTGAAVALVALMAGSALGVTGKTTAAGDPVYRPNTAPLKQSEEDEQELLERDSAFLSSRLAGTSKLDAQQAGALRAEAARAAARIRKEGTPTPGPATFTGPWAGIGPNPIYQVTRNPAGGNVVPVSGRIGALAIRADGTWILGAAQGGIWLWDPVTGWASKTDDQPSLAIGALAVAPSNDSVVYAGTGEGAMSGDSYFGNGVMKSTDGGATWTHVSGDYFRGVSMSRIVVDPTNADHVYAAVLRGRGGARRTPVPVHSRYGIWESTDGGTSWSLLREVPDENGATDLEIDPQNPNVLYASFWSDAIYKSVDAGKTWAPIMNGLPAGADYVTPQTRFSLGISHPSGQGTTLYAGFEWADGSGDHSARVFKSTDGGAHWNITSAGSGIDTVEGYCGEQCWYDNVIETDPTNPDVVYAGGMFNYGSGTGGIYRSDDGGATWKDLGWDQHPDFHAFAFDPNNPNHVLIGSDGGVWYSENRGGRTAPGAAIDAVDWQDVNGYGLQITQFTSIATNPTRPTRFWGGSQDNGTEAAYGHSWYDLYSGDGGQVLVDPTDYHYVYGTYYGISPYRSTDGGSYFFSNSYIRNGINLSDRSDFYAPWVLNRDDPNQLFLGTQRLYRTDNAKASSAGKVLWKPISPDLTSGCTGTAPNGARNCSLSAIGVGGGDAVYTGSLDGLVYLSTDAQTAEKPTWTRLKHGKLPERPVAAIAVDRSNYRIAYLAYNGFNAATPSRPGHVFRTFDGGSNWADISGNLPDTPVNSVVLDPSYPNTLYVGTDVGPFVTYDGGAHWAGLGEAFPVVSIWQLDLDPSHRTLAAGTHGRGAFTMDDATPAPALELSGADAGTPIGSGSDLTYTLTLRNLGNAAATNVTLSDPVPPNTTYVSGGTNTGGTVSWSGISVAPGATVSKSFTVKVADLKNKVDAIVNDGSKASGDGGFSTTGSPIVTPIAPAYAVSVVPATQTDGARVGESVTYTLTLTNEGYSDDSYALSSSGGSFPVEFLDSSCTTTQSTTPTVASGASTDVCVRVTVPATATNGTTSTASVTAASTGGSVSAAAQVKTIAVAVDTLLVDGDGNGPDVQSYYATALNTAGVQFSTWDLAADSKLPEHYVRSFKNVVWFTGNTYPGPIQPYEDTLAAFLDDGGNLLMSGQDILDQAAGTTPFVQNYLHITWDGTEIQNDVGTDAVHGVSGNAVSDGIGDVPLDHSVLDAEYEDEITPNGTASPAFTDDDGQPDALTYSGAYKVVFLAFPLEAYGTAGDKADLVSRTMSFFGP